MRPAPAVSATAARQAPAWTATGASAYLSACLKLPDKQQGHQWQHRHSFMPISRASRCNADVVYCCCVLCVNNEVVSTLCSTCKACADLSLSLSSVRALASLRRPSSVILLIFALSSSAPGRRLRLLLQQRRIRRSATRLQRLLPRHSPPGSGRKKSRGRRSTSGSRRQRSPRSISRRSSRCHSRPSGHRPRSCSRDCSRRARGPSPRRSTGWPLRRLPSTPRRAGA